VYATSTLELPTGSTLVLFTDGLVEERDEDLDVGLDRAADAVRGLAAANRIVRRLTRLRTAAHRSDDTAILAAHLRIPGR